MEPAVLTPLNLFWQAGPVVKTVVLILIASSVWCWVVISEVAIAVVRLRREIRARQLNGNARSQVLDPIFEAGRGAAAVRHPGEDLRFTRARIQEAMRQKAAELIEAAEGGLPSLAVIASVAPFVGLFGTVWGIMTSFIGIAALKDTSLAVVAPGIAEALAATAIGLVAAIPAAVGYNRLGAGLARCGRALGRLIESESLRLATDGSAVSREMLR